MKKEVEIVKDGWKGEKGSRRRVREEKRGEERKRERQNVRKIEKMRK